MIDAKDQAIDDDALITLLQQELSVALGSDQDDLQADRATALDYYFGRKPGAPSTADLSGAVSNDVADMIEALKAQIMPSFTGDDIAVFEATSPQDEDQAQLESDLVNYMVMQRCDGYQVFYQAVHDALLTRNGIVKVFVDEYERVSKKQYPELDELSLQLLQAQTADTLYADTNSQGTVVTRLQKVRNLRVCPVDPDNFRIATDQRSLDMQECRFCAESTIETEGSLIEKGFDPDVVADLPTWDVDTNSASAARNQSQQEDEHSWYERSQRPIKVWECYIVIDLDGDGYPELHKIIMPDGGRVILSDELVDYVPYAVGVPFINPHRWIGISVFEKIKSIADQKTEFLRQWIDNIRYHNNPFFEVVESLTNMKDFANPAPGRGVRVKQAGSIREVPVSDIGPVCQSAMAYLDKQRSERCGASLDMQTQGLPSGDETAHGVERQMAFKEQMAGMITRTLAETLVKPVFLLVHRCLRLYFPGVMAARKNGMWLQADPQTWGEREHVNINVGASQGERARQAAALQIVMQNQATAMQFGFDGVLVGPDQIYQSQIDYCRLMGLENPSQYWINPSSPSAQQSAQMKGMQAQQSAAEQAGMSKRVIDIEEFKAAQDAEDKLRRHELEVARIALEQENTVDDNMREWTDLEKKYRVDIPGKGV